jgi:hypothetical protein
MVSKLTLAVSRACVLVAQGFNRINRILILISCNFFSGSPVHVLQKLSDVSGSHLVEEECYNLKQGA